MGWEVPPGNPLLLALPQVSEQGRVAPLDLLGGEVAVQQDQFGQPDGEAVRAALDAVPGDVPRPWQDRPEEPFREA